ncbi:hypothetical protein RRG08_031007 [Elysia crispata]|uniref:Uncharacterized protein n=1 Tax=Elysia crispata TaxID=231223 RepID=A0AAE1AFK7_9GAST|nr:hypothetical protein RRG08_031007 [Elysia crispata]
MVTAKQVTELLDRMLNTLDTSLITSQEERHQRNLNENKQLKKQVAEMEDRVRTKSQAAGGVKLASM